MVDSVIRLFEQNIEPTYNPSTTRWDWVGLGIGVISDAISCNVEEERNGKFELVMEYPTTGMRYEELQINRIVVAKPNPESDPQGFRIYEISKSMDRVITVYAEHISYQLAHVPILPLSAENCKGALDALFNSANQGEDCHFQYYTDKDNTYFSKTSGSVKTGDYEGRYLEFRWTLINQSASASTISWKLVGCGKLANYTNGWVMCGPVNLSVGNTKLLTNAHNHPNRVQLREYRGSSDDSDAERCIDSGTKTFTHTNGKFSAAISLDAFLYYDYNSAGNGKVSGTGKMTLPEIGGGSTPVAPDERLDEKFKIEVPTSLRSALGGGTGSILDLYGGEFEWDNLTVKLHAARGRDKGVTIRYGKNLTSLEQEESIANTYTGILPYWRGQEPDDKETTDDGAIVIVTPTHILRNGVALPDIPAAKDSSGTTVTKDAVYSENADLFPYKRTEVMDLSEYFRDFGNDQEFDSDTTQFERFWSTVPMPQDVYDMAVAWVDTSSIGKPEVDLTVEFVPLWQTEEYKALALQESVGLCDLVHVFFEELNVAVSAKIVKYNYDVLLGRYKSIDLSSTGTLKTTLASTIASTPELIDAATKETTDFVNVALEDATNRITGVYGGSIIYNKDAAGNLYEMVIAGTPESDGTYGNFMRFNKEGIGFSTQGYNGPFNSAWTIDGTFDAQQINVINLNAGSMTAGTLKSSNYDSSGGTAGFSLDLTTGAITAPSLSISQSAVSGLSSRLNTIESDATGIRTSITETNTRIDNLAVGGTNLLRESRKMPASGSDYTIRYYAGSGSGYTFTFADSTDGDFREAKISLSGLSAQVWPYVSSSFVPRAKFESAKKLTFSFEIKVDNLSNWDGPPSSTTSSNVLVRITCKDSAHNSMGLLGARYISRYIPKALVPKAGTWYRVHITSPELWQDSGWISDGDGTWSDVEYVSAGVYASYNGSIHIRKFKLEDGELNTDWSPAPEDSDAALDAYAKTVTENYYTKTETAALASTTVGERVSELVVSGNNLLKDSETDNVILWTEAEDHGATMSHTANISVPEWNCTNAYRIQGKSGTSSTLFGLLYGTHLSSNISVAGQKYTFSIYIQNDGTDTVWVGFNSLGSSVAIAAGDRKRVISTNAVGNGTNSLQFTFATRSAGDNYNIVYWHPQIEYGPVATGWSDTLSSGTMAVVSSTYSTRTQTSEAINDRVESMTIGSTNLLVDSLKDADKSHQAYSIADFYFTEHLVAGKKYTISASVTMSSVKQRVGFYHSDGNTPMSGWLNKSDFPDGIYKATFVATSEMEEKSSGTSYGCGFCRVYAGVSGDSGTAHVNWIKCEKGEFATDWSPAPDDNSSYANSLINTLKTTTISDITEEMGTIKATAESKVSQGDYDTKTGEFDEKILSHSKALAELTPDKLKVTISNETSDIKGVTDSVKTWLDFSATDYLVIGKEGNVYNTQITNDAFNIRKGTSVVGTFNSGGLDTTSITLDKTINLPPFVLESISGGWLLTEA